MAAVFEVGKAYETNDPGRGCITILKRTEKTVWVENWSGSKWAMRVKTDDQGDEFVCDSSVPPSWRDTFTYSARWEYC